MFSGSVPDVVVFASVFFRLICTDIQEFHEFFLLFEFSFGYEYRETGRLQTAFFQKFYIFRFLFRCNQDRHIAFLKQNSIHQEPGYPSVSIRERVYVYELSVEVSGKFYRVKIIPDMLPKGSEPT